MIQSANTSPFNLIYYGRYRLLPVYCNRYNPQTGTEQWIYDPKQIVWQIVSFKPRKPYRWYYLKQKLVSYYGYTLLCLVVKSKSSPVPYVPTRTPIVEPVNPADPIFVPPPLQRQWRHILNIREINMYLQSASYMTFLFSRDKQLSACVGKRARVELFGIL